MKYTKNLKQVMLAIASEYAASLDGNIWEHEGNDTWYDTKNKKTITWDGNENSYHGNAKDWSASTWIILNNNGEVVIGLNADFGSLAALCGTIYAENEVA